MNVLLTGGAGFIGSILARSLLDEGHMVRIMDNITYGLDPIRSINLNPNLELMHGDIRTPTDVNKALEGVDSVIHLAAIVGDPACAVQADKAIEINYLSTLRIAKTAKDKGIGKFIFASTCSVYGASNDVLSENSELEPKSLYAETKMLAEKGILDIAGENFQPKILRLGTLYGLSYRPRFDLVINYLTGKIINENKALIFGGEQWRPFLHVEDAVGAFLFTLKNYDKMAEDTFNVGANDQNYQMSDIGKIFQDIFPKSDIQKVDKIKDPRSYRVNFNRIETYGFLLKKEIKPTIIELRDWIIKNEIDLTSPEYYNYHP